MRWTIKIKFVVLGIAIAQFVATLAFLAQRTSLDIERALSSGTVFSQDGPLIADLVLAGRDMALDATPSPAERRAQRYSSTRVATFDRNLERIREGLGAFLATRPESRREQLLMTPNRTLLALERKVTLDLRRAVDSGAPEEELLLVLEEVRALAFQLDAEFRAMAPERGSLRDSLPEDLHYFLAERASMNLSVNIIGLITVMALLVFVGRSITRPLDALAETLEALAEGRTEIEIPGQGRMDEFSRAAKALQRIKEALAGSRRR